MPKFRKKLGEPFEAEQFIPGVTIPLGFTVVQGPEINPLSGKPHVFAYLEQNNINRVVLWPGDWVVTHPNGVKYAWISELFNSAFELVEESC